MTGAGAGRVVRRGLDTSGLGVTALFFCVSLTPSLLPRMWILQGAVSGIASVCGYGLGVLLGAVTRRLGSRSVEGRALSVLRWTVLGGGAALALVVLLLSHGWQEQQRRLLGMAPPDARYPARIVIVAAAVFAVLLLLSRLVRLITRKIIKILGRFVPAPVAYVAGFTAGVVLVAGFVQGFVFNSVVEVMNSAASVTNKGTAAGITRPASPLISGAPASLARWSTLGFEGRYFTATATPAAGIAAFTGRPAAEPIRVYVGLGSAGSFEAQARLAVRELERTGAFRRSVIAVVTTTGTGWVNERAASALEYLHGGNTAIVSMQYSYLPSWLSFLVDKAKAAKAARALIDAVHAKQATLPANRRPKLLLYGESLGSYGIEEATSGLPALTAKADGALLVGPPFANPIHNSLTDRRDRGSPVWRPVYQEGRTVRFARIPTDLRSPAARWQPPRLVYLQNATDPIVWWSPDLLFEPPRWLRSPRGPDVTPLMRWFPIVTFWQTVVDLVAAGQVPAGHGHLYGSNVVDGLVALFRPPGWSEHDTDRLRTLIGSFQPKKH